MFISDIRGSKTRPFVNQNFLDKEGLNQERVFHDFQFSQVSFDIFMGVEVHDKKT